MRKLTSAIVLLCFIASLGLMNQCKPDQKVVPNDPDSNYVSHKMAFPKPNLPNWNMTVYQDTSNLSAEGVQLGRMLFYDPVLSVDSTISCSSCHKQQFAFSDGGKQFSKNVTGAFTKRNAPALQNMAWMKQVFWDGRAATLEAQIMDALMNEQHVVAPNAIAKLNKRDDYVKLFKKAFGRPLTISEDNIHKAIKMFMLTLISSSSEYDQVKLASNGHTPYSDPAKEDGFQLFVLDTAGNGTTIMHGADCWHCHVKNTPLVTDNLFRNNGLDSFTNPLNFPDIGYGNTPPVDTHNNAKFKVPTFRNVELTGPYMHDGRFATLDDVVSFYTSGLHRCANLDPLMKYVDYGGAPLTAQQKQDLVTFLKTMTDTVFTHNPAFSNPF